MESSSGGEQHNNNNNNIRGTQTHVRRYVQYNIYGNLFDVSRKYVPLIPTSVEVLTVSSDFGLARTTSETDFMTKLLLNWLEYTAAIDIYGILVIKGHETFVSNCFLGQSPTVGGDLDESRYSGTAVDIDSNDNALTNVAIFSAAVGVVLRSEANTITGVHCYNKANVYGGVGIVVKPEASLTRITGCYMDFTDVVIEDPDQVRVTDGLFIGGANVVLKSIRGSITGLNVEGNMFRGYEGKGNSIVELDGNFTAVDQVVVDRNNVKDMVLKSTAGKMTVAGYGSRWVADFSRVLIFPDRSTSGVRVEVGGVIVAVDVHRRAGVAALVEVAADCGALAEEAIGDEGLVALDHQNPLSCEMEEEAVVNSEIADVDLNN